MGKLEDYFVGNKGRLMTKWLHYFDIYERHFGRFVGQEVNVLEIGVFHGGSLQMWKHYFGDQAAIYGLDVNPRVKSLEEDRIHILIGDQGDRNFWTGVKPSLPVFDIIIDDGGHTMDQQRITFEELYPLLSPTGVYLIEDLHTSYWPRFGGGYERPDSFVEYSKRLIDKLNAWHSTWSMSYYDSVLVIEKRPIVRPASISSGFSSWKK
jgi:hypothetical protein